MNRDFLSKPNYTFDPEDGLDLKDHPEYHRILEQSRKEPHELLSDDILDWGRIAQRRATDVRFMTSSEYSTIWDYIEPPLGAYNWLWFDGCDEGLGVLREIGLNELIPLDYAKWQFNIFEQYKIQRYRKIYQVGPTVGTGNPQKILSTYINPLKVYRLEGDQLVVVDGVKRLHAAKLEGVKTLKAWVFDSEKLVLKNRHHYRNIAIQNGLDIPEDDKIGTDSPAPVPRLTYKEYRRMSYPPIHDQLDAITKYLEDGDYSDLKRINDQVQSVKAKFPK